MSLWRISVGKELKENIMCIKVHEKLVEEKNGSCKLCLMCKREKKCRKETWKKIERKKKVKRKKNTKRKMCMMSKK